MRRDDMEQLADEVQTLFRTLVRAGTTLGRPEELQLTNTQALALGIAVQEGQLRLRALADAMGATDATASRTVDALEARGLVARSKEPRDRRGIVVRPTDAGRRLELKRRRRLVRLLRQLLEDVETDDVSHLVMLLSELNAQLSKRSVHATRQ